MWIKSGKIINCVSTVNGRNFINLTEIAGKREFLPPFHSTMHSDLPYRNVPLKKTTNEIGFFNLHMLHGVVKKHKVHDSVHFIVILQCLCQQFIQWLPALYSEVLRFPNTTCKMTEHVWLGVQSLFIKILRRKKHTFKTQLNYPPPQKKKVFVDFSMVRNR